MPTSDITSVAFRHELFVGNVITFRSNVTTDSTSPFDYDITIDPIQPYVDAAHFFAQPTAIDGTDADGIYYGGNYKPTVSAVQVSGSGLTATQRQTIMSCLGFNISPDRNGEDRYTLNVTPIAAVGAQFFSIRIPYTETVVVNNSPVITVPFLTVAGDSIAANPTIVTVDQTNRKFIIDAGLLINDYPALSFENISTGRTFSSATAQKSSGLFGVSWVEDLSGRSLLVVDNVFPTQPVQIGGYVYGVNYKYRVQRSGSDLSVNVARQLGRVVLGGSTLEDISQFVLVQAFPGVTGTLTVSSHSSVALSYTCSGSVASRTGNVLRITHLPTSITNTLTVVFATTFIQISGLGRLPNGSIGNVSERRDLPSGSTISDAIFVLTELQDLFSQTYGINFQCQVTINLAMIDNSPWSSINSTTQNIPINQTGAWLTLTANLVSSPRTATMTLSDTDTVNDVILFLYDQFPDLPFFAGMANSTLSWVDFPAKVLQSTTQTFTGGSSPDTPSTVYLPGGGEFSNDTSTFTLSSFTTLSNLASAITADTTMDSIDVMSRAGIYYEALDPSSYIPASYDSGNVNSLFDNPGFVNVTASPGTTNNGSYSVALDGTVDIADLVQSLNSNLSGLFAAAVLDNQYATSDADTLVNNGPIDVSISSGTAVFEVEFSARILQEYSFVQYPTLPGLVTAINAYWSSRGVTVSINPEALSHPTEGISDNLQDNTALGGENAYNITFFLAGFVHAIDTPAPPVEYVTFNFNIRFAVGGNPNDAAGIQVALGGYESNGVLFANDAPNTFFEPPYNTLFPIEFTVHDADTIYLLVRTRENLAGTIFTSEIQNYAGSARFNNGSPAQSLVPIIPTDPEFTAAWTETNLGNPPASQVPVVLTISGGANQVDVFIDERQISDSIHVTIHNIPSELNDFGFLAINRSNLSGSMTESRDGRTFGLALDNRGIWDVLIGPEAELRKATSGEFDYLGSSYERTILDDDEAYDFSFYGSSLPTQISSAISLIPVPGYPQVWVLRIERGIKDYLAAQRDSVDRTSSDGCSIDIDMLVTGRVTGVQGICRVTVFYDVYCVFDTELCDAFWNLTDPPEPSGPPLIENQLVFEYESLIDCSRLDINSNDPNTDLSVPMLMNIRHIPMFENGNALLLIKSFYTAEIQGFYFPIGEDLSNLQFEDCSTVADNQSLSSRLNKTLLYLPNQTNPITDPFAIESLLATETSYMYIKPAFQFPVSDPLRDCGPNEVVIVGIGYQFKNWTNGLREDDVLFGVRMVIPGGVFVAPELQICCRYYYDQLET